MLRDLVIKTRSCRRFDQAVSIEKQTLLDLVDLARMSASGMNKQPLKYILSWDKETNDLIFPHLGWAGALSDWPGPAEGERPSAYVVILGDTEISPSFGVDPGIAAQTIMLGAREKGLAGCMIGSAKKEPLRKALSIPSRYEIVLVLALGHPAETIIIEAMGDDGDYNYWRDDEGQHHVPKRSLEEIILSDPE
jgi:nitroreductase